MRESVGRYRSSRTPPLRAPRGIFGGNKSIKYGLIAVSVCILIIQIYNRTAPRLMTGPINDVFASHPERLVIIYGTHSPDSDSLRNYLLKVSRLQSKNLGHEVLLYPDTLADKELLENYSLILYGPLEQNLVTRTMRDFFPFEFSGEGVALGSRRYSGSDWRLVFAMPNPLNKRRYVLVYTGPAVSSLIGINFLGNPNFVHHDSTDYVLAEGDRIVEQGYFDKSDPARWVLPHQ